MKKVAFLTLILFLAAILRFYSLGTVPPLFHSSSFLFRSVTAIISLINVLLTYKLSVHYSGRVKIGLLSAFVMGILPWTIEEGRVYSTVNNSLAILMTGIIFWQKFRTKRLKLFTAIITLVVFILVYPDIWLLKNFQLIPIMGLRDNLFRLLSPQMWLFNNITFYHGGLREWGMLYVSLLPFLLLGFIKSFNWADRCLYFVLFVLIIVSAASPFFPESREFFLATPLLSFFIGIGFYELFRKEKYFFRLCALALVLVVIYEFSQLLHYYYIHYPLNVRESADKIYEPF